VTSASGDLLASLLPFLGDEHEVGLRAFHDDADVPPRQQRVDEDGDRADAQRARNDAVNSGESSMASTTLSPVWTPRPRSPAAIASTRASSSS
jgi:hypothetical protein